jgi:hypothetical protein
MKPHVQYPSLTEGVIMNYDSHNTTNGYSIPYISFKSVDLTLYPARMVKLARRHFTHDQLTDSQNRYCPELPLATIQTFVSLIDQTPTPLSHSSNAR